MAPSLFPFMSVVGAFDSTASLSSASTVALTHNGIQKKDTLTESLPNRMRNVRERGFKMQNGKKHHPHRKEDAPYPRDYERKTIDQYVARNEHVIKLKYQ
jgi:hypothetical protein